MIERIIIYVLATLILLTGGYGYYQSRVNKSLRTENANKADAIAAYEQIIKVIPFSAMISERKETTGETINTIFSDDSNIVPDGIYKRM